MEPIVEPPRVQRAGSTPASAQAGGSPRVIGARRVGSKSRLVDGRNAANAPRVDSDWLSGCRNDPGRGEDLVHAHPGPDEVLGDLVDASDGRLIDGDDNCMVLLPLEVPPVASAREYVAATGAWARPFRHRRRGAARASGAGNHIPEPPRERPSLLTGGGRSGHMWVAIEAGYRVVPRRQGAAGREQRWNWFVVRTPRPPGLLGPPFRRGRNYFAWKTGRCRSLCTAPPPGSTGCSPVDQRCAIGPAGRFP